MMNVPYVVLKYATLLLSFPINNVVEVVLTTLSAILKCTNNPAHLQGCVCWCALVGILAAQVHNR